MRSQPERAFHPLNQRNPAPDRGPGKDDRRPKEGRACAEEHGHERPGEGVPEDRARIAERIDGSDSASPPQLMPPQVPARHVAADMRDGEWRNANTVAAGAQRVADRIVVRKAVGKSLESADLRQGLAPER